MRGPPSHEARAPNLLWVPFPSRFAAQDGSKNRVQGGLRRGPTWACHHHEAVV